MDKGPASKSMALQVTHGEARADSRLIAVELQNQHHHDGYTKAKAALATLRSLAIEGGAA